MVVLHPHTGHSYLCTTGYWHSWRRSHVELRCSLLWGRPGLGPGKLADIVVLSQGIFAGPPEAILDTVVDMTIVGGRVGDGGKRQPRECVARPILYLA